MSSPKEKAIELIEKFECLVDYQGDDCFTEREKMLINAKRCALIAVDEIINCDNYFNTLADAKEFINYWYEVQQEIENL